MNSRARIRIDTYKEAVEFVSILNKDGTADKYVLENFTGSYIVNARSLLGVVYASGEFDGKIFLVNTTHDGVYPREIDKFRPL